MLLPGPGLKQIPALFVTMGMKNYLIVGASSGIGRQLALTLASRGSRVYGTYLTHPVEEETEGLSHHRLNVLDDEPDFGFVPETLDGLAYCPGSIRLKPFHRIKPEEFAKDYELQVLGAIRSIQQVLPRLKKSGQASVVLFSTVAVQHGFNFHSMVSASKGALEGLGRALAAELAPGIRVNLVAPSLTDTPLASGLLNSDSKREANAKRHPLQRTGEPADIANMAAFLLSDESAWITGQVMGVDGGISTLKL